MFGWRPPLFRRDYPKTDWPVFVESVTEFPQRDEINSAKNPNSGAGKVPVGPAVLGLHGPWGAEAGALFPVHEEPNGQEPAERFRVKFVFTCRSKCRAVSA